MNTKTTNPTGIKVTMADLEKPNAQLTSLEQQAGAIGRFQAKWALRDTAKGALVGAQEDRIHAMRDIQKTAITLTTATIKATMVADAMPALGTLTTKLNMATGSVDQALTNGSTVETYTHMSNRKQNHEMIDSLLAEGKVDHEEAETLKAKATAESYADINRTNERLAMAKDTVAAIHEFGVLHIQRAKDSL